MTPDTDTAAMVEPAFGDYAAEASALRDLLAERDATITRLTAEMEGLRAERDAGEAKASRAVLRATADYLQGYAGGHYMAQSCAAAVRELALDQPFIAAAIRKGNYILDSRNHVG